MSPKTVEKVDTAFGEAVSKQIITHNCSPYDVLQYFELNSWPSDLRICEKTLYRYIYEETCGAFFSLLPCILFYWARIQLVLSFFIETCYRCL